MDKDKVVYELAFHINPDLEESQVQQLSRNIEAHITSNEGFVLFKKEPEKTRLSYPIKHRGWTYFGYYHFTLGSPESLTSINEQIKLDNHILRYLMVKVPADTGKVRFSFKPPKSKVKTDKPVEKQTPAESKELDKQLEGILENL